MGGKSSRHDEFLPNYYVLGLKGTGKTTVIERLDKERGLENPSVPRAFPPEFFNNDEDGMNSNWEIGGRDSRRPLYHYVARKALLGVIFVFDSTNVERLDEAIVQLKQFVSMTYESEGTVIMILANKQDMDGAVTPEYIETKVKEGCESTHENSLYVMPCCAVSGKGLLVAYDYFVQQSKLRKEGKLQLDFISSAWESINWEKAEEELNKTDDVIVEKRDSTIVHKMKKSVFKNPFKALKSVLFC